MPLYFAYGANMDTDGMALRCPSSTPLGLARLPRHRWIISTDGYANVVRDPRRVVQGMLWELALSDVPTLDRFEDVPRLYRKVIQPVITPKGVRRALVYVGRSDETGRPRPGYLDLVLKAAASARLPDRDIATMKAYGDMRPAMKPTATAAKQEKWVWTP
jgi:gamma-glutamylcyclotransferase (GGCT)/AIG2-like uncharacterized protein YtfP